MFTYKYEYKHSHIRIHTQLMFIVKPGPLIDDSSELPQTKFGSNNRGIITA